MKTPYLDEAIDMYERMQITSSEGGKLREYKAIKEALSIHSVMCSCCKSNKAKICDKCNSDMCVSAAGQN